MKKSHRSILALGAFFVVAALLVSACGSSNKLPSNSVAVVAGNPISTRAVDHWMYVEEKGQSSEQQSGSPVIVPNDPPSFAKCMADARASIPSLKKTADKTLRSECQQLFTSLSSQILEYLIQSYWYQAQAHKLGIEITSAQVAKDVAKAKKSAGIKTDAQYKQFLSQSGETDQDVRFRILVSDIYAKLIARHPTKVTSADIAAYYAAHKSSYGTPQSLNMRIVLAKTAANARTALAALRSGSSWKTVAKRYSIDPTTKNNAGLLTGVTKGQQDQALTKAAFAARPNTLVGPVKGQFGYYVVEVVKKTAPTQKTLAQATSSIRSTLTQQRQSAAESAVQNAAEKAWKSKTKCRRYWSMNDCAGYVAPKTSSTSAAAGGSTATAPATGSTTAASSSAAKTATTAKSSTTSSSSK